MTTTQAPRTGTRAYYTAEMTKLAEHLDSIGNAEGAADVRNDIRVLSTPRAKARIICDSCHAVIRSARQVHKYDTLGVDWVHCTKCERSNA